MCAKPQVKAELNPTWYEMPVPSSACTPLRPISFSRDADSGQALLNVSGSVADHIFALGPEYPRSEQDDDGILLYMRFERWDELSRQFLEDFDILHIRHSDIQMKPPLAKAISASLVERYADVMVANMYEVDAPNQRHSAKAYQLSRGRRPDDDIHSLDHDTQGLLLSFRGGVYHVAEGRRICVTGHGRLVLVPGSARIDDMIAIVDGCPPPMVLRKHGDGVRLVGAAYVEGLNSYLPFDERITDATREQQFRMY